MAPNKGTGGYIELQIPEGQAINVRSSGDPAMIYPINDDQDMAHESVSLRDDGSQGDGAHHNQLTAMVDGAVKLVNMLNFMKVELGDKNTFRSKEVWRSAGAEFVATLLFVFIGCGSVVATGMLAPGLDSARLVAIAVAHGLAIALLAGATGAISGGHINPAVTVAFVVAGKENLIRASVYIGAQLLGGIFGAALLDMCTPGHFVGGLGSHSLGHGVNAGQGLVMEVMLTFILVFTIFGVAVDRRGPGVIAPLPIGFAVLVDHLVGVPYTGASMNPARSFGPALVSGSFTSAHWIYWFGPCIGAALAAFVYKHIFLQAPIVPMVQDQKPEKKVVLSA